MLDFLSYSLSYFYPNQRASNRHVETTVVILLLEAICATIVLFEADFSDLRYLMTVHYILSEKLIRMKLRSKNLFEHISLSSFYQKRKFCFLREIKIYTKKISLYFRRIHKKT